MSVLLICYVDSWLFVSLFVFDFRCLLLIADCLCSAAFAVRLVVFGVLSLGCVC